MLKDNDLWSSNKLQAPIKSKLLFNPNVSDDDIRVIGGDTTNLLNLNYIKYQWAHDIFDVIYKNGWLPHKVPMGDDKLNFHKLSAEEQESYKIIVSFLVFLDSLQTNNLGNISNFITAPDIVFVLARQTFDEAIHSKSYGWLLSSIFTRKEAEDIVYYWKKHDVLMKRIIHIASIYQELIDNPTIMNLLRSIIANYLLEGIYFYNGFQFFHNLNSRGLMVATDTQIRYIQRDEIQHCNIFKNIILEIKKENPDIWEQFQPTAMQMVKEAVQWEIDFSRSIMDNRILGITDQSIEDYSYYLGNRRLKDIKEKALFPKIEKNPYQHLEMIAGVESESSNRSNNFEVTSINYKNISALKGFNDI
jgi:ribonucleoside-diphosphate reductase beta chain